MAYGAKYERASKGLSFIPYRSLCESADPAVRAERSRSSRRRGFDARHLRLRPHRLSYAPKVSLHRRSAKLPRRFRNGFQRGFLVSTLLHRIDIGGDESLWSLRLDGRWTMDDGRWTMAERPKCRRIRRILADGAPPRAIAKETPGLLKIANGEPDVIDAESERMVSCIRRSPIDREKESGRRRQFSAISH
jgi:hypothetical protein